MELSSYRRALAAVFILVLIGAVILTVDLLSGGGNDEPDMGGALSPTLETPASMTPAATASPSAEEQVKSFALEPVTGEAEFIQDGTQIPPANLGVYCQDIESGAIEGWNLLLQGTHVEGFSRDNRFNVFRRREQIYQDGVIYYAGAYLADRATGTVYRWTVDAGIVYANGAFHGSNIASEDDRVLFRIRDESGVDWFVVIAMDQSPRVVHRFHLENMWSTEQDDTAALFSPDGSKVAIFGQDSYVVDVTTGQSQRIPTDVRHGQAALNNMTLQLAGAGSSFLALVEYPQEESFWYRIGWDGRLIAEGSGTALYPSPDGTNIAALEGSPVDLEGWGVISAISTEDGSPQFRVVGVSAWFGGYTGANRWLADNSGFVVSNSNLEMSIAMRDGSLNPYVGLPSPESPDRFWSGDSIVDGTGRLVTSASLPVSALDFVPPFGESDREVRYLTPHGGHDCCQGAFSLIEPYVEQPPYSDPPWLQLSDAANGAELLDTPLSGQAVATLSGATRVTLHEVQMLCTDPTFGSPASRTPDCAAEHHEVHEQFLARHTGYSSGVDAAVSGFWARVTTEDGQEGWLLLSVHPRGV